MWKRGRAIFKLSGYKLVRDRFCPCNILESIFADIYLFYNSLWPHSITVLYDQLGFLQVNTSVKLRLLFFRKRISDIKVSNHSIHKESCCLILVKTALCKTWYSLLCSVLSFLTFVRLTIFIFFYFSMCKTCSQF